MEDVESKENLVPERETGAEIAGWRVGPRLDMFREAVDNIGHIAWTDQFGKTPGIAAGKVEAAVFGGSAAHCLELREYR